MSFEQPLATPILFLLFNRLDTTQQVFQEIRKAQPSKLYIAIDGPRTHVESDFLKIKSVQNYVLENIDWDCQLHTLFREENLGCRVAVSTAINWFFEHENSGIILEDDCLPHPDFFLFCDALLEKYSHNDQVWMVTGDNFQYGQKRGDFSYYFSKYNHCWGWATWRNAWKNYRDTLEFWPEWKLSLDWQERFDNNHERFYWTKIFDDVYNGRVDTWDYPWLATMWYYGGMTATPNVNLVSNIGFGQQATHTTEIDSQVSNLPTQSLGELTHPPEVIASVAADQYVYDVIYGGKYAGLKGLPLRFLRKLNQMYQLK